MTVIAILFFFSLIIVSARVLQKCFLFRPEKKEGFFLLFIRAESAMMKGAEVRRSVLRVVSRFRRCERKRRSTHHTTTPPCMLLTTGVIDVGIHDPSISIILSREQRLFDYAIVSHVVFNVSIAFTKFRSAIPEQSKDNFRSNDCTSS